jgi:glyoxylase-like metal-dependent hydrolase (beta-lactamase superfamily II)
LLHLLHHFYKYVLFAGILHFSAGALCYTPKEPSTQTFPKEAVMEILPNIHLIPDIIANPYLLIDPDGLTLIDAGLPGSHRKILRYMAGLGFVPADLRRILITHADFDHVGGLAALKAATGARVFASPVESQAMGEGHSSRPLKPRSVIVKLLFDLMARLFKPAPVQADELLTDGQVLPVLGGPGNDPQISQIKQIGGGGLLVVETSGHTPGHISLYARSAGVLFCGDSMVSEENGLRGSRGANNWDQAKADESVRKQTALGARIVCSGHGPVVMDAAGKFPNV